MVARNEDYPMSHPKNAEAKKAQDAMLDNSVDDPELRKILREMTDSNEKNERIKHQKEAIENDLKSNALRGTRKQM